MESRRAISVSLGSTSRNFRYIVECADFRLTLQRIGTDGNTLSCGYLLRHFDGNAQAIGLGGINLAYRTGRHHYPLPEAQWLAGLARYTPVVDGAGGKRCWEQKVVALLSQQQDVQWQRQRVLVLSALDRWELAQALAEAGAELRIADPLMALGIPLVFRQLPRFEQLTTFTMPFLSLLPIKTVYPQAPKEGQRVRGQRIMNRLRDWATCIVGDHRFLQRLTPQFHGQILLTSGVSQRQAATYLSQGAGSVISMNYLRSHGPLAANLVEAALVACSGLPLDETPPYLVSHYVRQLGLCAARWSQREGVLSKSLLSSTG